MPLVVDASVWVSAADRTDDLSGPSRDFLSAAAAAGIPVALPDFAELEVACALARRLRDPERGRALADGILRSPLVTVHPLDPTRLRRAVEVGTDKLLRAGDAPYAALSDETVGEVVSWDQELIERAGAITPRAWLVRNAPSPEPDADTSGGPASSEAGNP